MGGAPESHVAVQAVADFASVARGAVVDLTTACRGIATDLGVDAAAGEAADKQADAQATMNAWCALAASAITGAKAKVNARLILTVVPPRCSTSVSARESCLAKCAGATACDVTANPLTCTGGTLEISCQGVCKGSDAKPSVGCDGACNGGCTGACTAPAPGVECNGTCDGTCAAGGSAGGTGIQADGICKGLCTGTCAVTLPGVTCVGACSGSCEGTCEATPGGAAVTCDGECDVGGTPLRCEGGTLEGGCEVSALCDANCEASVSAHAECAPPNVEISFAAGAEVQIATELEGALEANLPLIYALEARLDRMVGSSSVIGQTGESVFDVRVFCVLQVAVAGAAAVSDVGAAASAADRVLATVR
jgi:hypothetical protein